MKKIASVLVSLGLVLAMGIQIIAAPSIVGKLDVPGVSSNIGDAKLTEVTPGMYPEPLQSEVDALNAANPSSSVKDAFGSYWDSVKPIPLYDAAAKNIVNPDENLANYKFLSPVMDLTIDGDFSAANPGDVTFTVNNLTDNIEVYALYYCEEHNHWELIPVSSINGNQVTVKLHSTSPVALVYKNKGTSTPSKGTSPQTGNTSAAGVMGMAVVALTAFGFYAVKRSRKEA